MAWAMMARREPCGKVATLGEAVTVPIAATMALEMICRCVLTIARRLREAVAANALLVWFIQGLFFGIGFCLAWNLIGLPFQRWWP